jgi:hypothetical protein
MKQAISNCVKTGSTRSQPELETMMTYREMVAVPDDEIEWDTEIQQQNLLAAIAA